MILELPPIVQETPTVFVKNRSMEWYVIDSGDKDIPTIVLPPHSEGGLPNAEFWVKSPKLRRFTDGENAPLHLYARKQDYAPVREVPAEIACEEQYTSNVQAIVSGPLDLAPDMGGAMDEILLHPQRGSPPVVDYRFLVHKWRPVLETALFVLKENRRVGKEVDQRRLDALERRLGDIENLRLEYGIARKAV